MKQIVTVNSAITVKEQEKNREKKKKKKKNDVIVEKSLTRNRRNTSYRIKSSLNDDYDDVVKQNSTDAKRREMLLKTACCACFLCSTQRRQQSNAFPQVVVTEENSEELKELFDHRDLRRDEVFAKAMTTMGGYERDVYERKRDLFTIGFRDFLFSAKKSDDGFDDGRSGTVIDCVELGSGTWPNARYYDMIAEDGGQYIDKIDVYGIDPNDYMTKYAMDSYANNVKSKKVRYRPLRGVSESLPFDDASVDIVACSLVLCSVEDQLASLKEVKRVLKPGRGKFIFVEHVLSQTNADLRKQQEYLTPLQMRAADGCRLNRNTGEAILDVFGAENVNLEYYDLQGYWVINSQISGIAYV